MNVSESEIKQLLKQYKKICVYGLNPDPNKPAHYVPLFMQSKGYDIVGIHPRGEDFGGFKIYAKLADVPEEYRKFVNVFRRSENIPGVVDEVLAAGGTEVLWLQLGITNAEAERTAEDAGLKVVSDRCLIIEYRGKMS
jgi:uncharacterized protein